MQSDANEPDGQSAEPTVNRVYPWPTCGAKTKSTGLPCRAMAIQPSGRCRLHGGLTPSGFSSVHLKHGRYSRDLLASLPAKFGERFQAAMADPELLSLRTFVGILDAKVIESLEKWTSSDSVDYRERLSNKWADFKHVNAEKSLTPEDREKKAEQITVIFNELDKLIVDGVEGDSAWSAVVSSIRERAALTVQESKRLVDLEQCLSIEQAMALVLSLHSAVKKIVTDPIVLQNIGREIQQATGMLANGHARISDVPSTPVTQSTA